ncbi:MAG: SLC13 family permease, partial [Victivallales bacterium]|nr:SLC13 family permease [Victivallales bacterium]
MEHSILFQLTWQGWLTILVILSCFLTVVFTKFSEDFTFLGGLFILLITGVLNTKEALSGFSSSGMITVAALYIVVAGLQETGTLTMISHHLLGYPKTYTRALFRLLFPVTGLSAFLNNTPVVAMFIPIVIEWCDSIKQQPSKLLIPLSYISIFGGICTLIGTSTNLVVNGLFQQHFHNNGLGMFEITKLGVPCAIVGILYLIFFGRKLLPSNPKIEEIFKNTNEYILELQVESKSSIVGKTIEEAGLRNLPGGFVAEINRGEEIITAVTPTEIIKKNDKLIIVGNIRS